MVHPIIVGSFVIHIAAASVQRLQPVESASRQHGRGDRAKTESECTVSFGRIASSCCRAPVRALLWCHFVCWTVNFVVCHAMRPRRYFIKLTLVAVATVATALRTARTQNYLYKYANTVAVAISLLKLRRRRLLGLPAVNSISRRRKQTFI